MNNIKNWTVVLKQNETNSSQPLMSLNNHETSLGFIALRKKITKKKTEETPLQNTKIESIVLELLRTIIA